MVGLQYVDHRIEISDVQFDPANLDTNTSPPSSPAAEHLPAGEKLPEFLDKIEKGLIENAIAEASGVQAHAAESLGITKSLLQYKMKKYDISKSS